MQNKKGSAVIWGFVIIFAALLVAIFLGVIVYVFSQINSVLSEDVDIGQVNLKNVTATTFGQISSGMVANADTIGVILLFGMCLLMILNGFFFGSKSIKLFFIVDIFLLALFFIPAVYVSQVYETFINSATVLQSTFINTIPKTSKFMLNLPVIVGTVGVLAMILSYIGIKKDDDEEPNVLGY